MGLSALVDVWIVIYPIFMRMISHWAAFIILLSNAVCVWAADPHALDPAVKEGETFAIDILAKKEPLKYKIENHSSKSVEDYKISEDYQKWFNNVLQQLAEPQSSELENITDILQFGASGEAYIKTEKDADIIFHFYETPEEIFEVCSPGAGACFKFKDGAMTIHALYPKENVRFYSYLVHEIGHSLRLEDLYEEHLPSTGGKYGSGIRKSIMKDSFYLTCDDADAVVNAIYLAKKLSEEDSPDLEFTSFCDKNISYKNAQQKDRAPMIIDYDGYRTIYTYCKDGRTQSITQIHPSNYDDLVKIIQEPTQCDFSYLEQPPLNISDKIKYRVADFKTDKTISLGGEIPALHGSKNTYIPIPYSNGLKIYVNIDGKDIPGYIKVLDSDNNVVYLFAYLKEGYNLVYDSHLSGKNVPSSYATLFVYERNSPDNFYAYRNPPNPKKQCYSPQIKCVEMKILLEKYSDHFIGQGGMKYPRLGGFSNKNRLQNQRDAMSWEKFLLKNYTPLSVSEEKLKRILSDHWEELKENPKIRYPKDK